jgi:hypothetical protein
MWLEWDCYLGKDRWYDTLWDELQAWPHQPIQAGTPVVSLQGLHGNFLANVQHYVGEFIKTNKVAMSFILNRPFFLTVNGAMAFYNVDKMHQYFQLPNYQPFKCFDITAGMRIFDEVGEDILKRTAWLPSLYSGWGEETYTVNQRLEMVNAGYKVAMHQYKV